MTHTNEYHMTAELRKRLAHRNRYDNGERLVLWICATIVVATIGWKAYQAAATYLAGVIR